MRTNYAQKSWSAQETELADQLIRDGASEAMFQELLGRTRQACRDRMRRLDTCIKLRSTIPPIPKIKVPESVIEDRNRRLISRSEMSLTAIAFGDPEPIRRPAFTQKYA